MFGRMLILGINNSDIDCVVQWVQTLVLLCKVANLCHLAEVDLLAVAEMTLRLAMVLEAGADAALLIESKEGIQTESMYYTFTLMSKLRKHFKEICFYTFLKAAVMIRISCLVTPQKCISKLLKGMFCELQWLVLTEHQIASNNLGSIGMQIVSPTPRFYNKKNWVQGWGDQLHRQICLN